MSTGQSIPTTLLDILAKGPGERTAIILPEQHVSVTYGALFSQVLAVGEQLAAAGVGRGDRVATSLTNGLPAIVSFLAASVAGTAAPLNPAYKEEEFRFFSGRHGGESADCPARTARKMRRRAAAGRVPDPDQS